LNGAPSHTSRTADLRRARILASRSEDKRGEWDPFKPHMRVELTGSVAFNLAIRALRLCHGGSRQRIPRAV
jgi:myo-inositol-1(or 4)-monophosphatase